jgi:hypothetical protein
MPKITFGVGKTNEYRAGRAKILAHRFANRGRRPIFATLFTKGLFVYRLGHQIFILVRGVRLPYGLQLNHIECHLIL